MTETTRRRPARSSRVMVDISDLKVTNRREDVLVTFSLGSCVGLALYDPVAGVGGLIHCMLPLSRIDPAKAELRPYMFVDTGVTAMLDEMYALGARQPNLIAKVAGAGSPLGRETVFQIGQRNYTVLRKLLWNNKIGISSEDVGGPRARTMYLHMTDGRTVVNSEGQEVEL